MKSYKNQVDLLLRVLPEVAKENCFALHGGTAINLFVRDMPRLSVDIDLTYIPMESRATSFKNISDALERIKINVEITIPGIKVTHHKDLLKLLFSHNGKQIKIEVNQAVRGLLKEPVSMVLSKKAQIEFDVFCENTLVDFGQLFGSKICAALDRQHPRDLFDVKYLLDNEGFTTDIKEGLLLSILGSKRPVSELLFPNLLNQSRALTNQFEGMSFNPFDYSDFETTREKLIKTIHSNLTASDKEFILNFIKLTPDWSLYNFEKFPAIQWKLKNLEKLKDENPEKHKKMYNDLKEKIKCIKTPG